MRNLRFVCFTITIFFALTSFGHADKLKSFYIGSGGYSAEVHRVLLLELAKDGTAVLQQNWHEREPESWHVHWTLNGKELVLTFDTVEGKPTPAPATFNLKKNSLVPVRWDSQYLGVLGPPTLMPFGGKTQSQGSLSGCKMLDYSQPTGCVQWDSRDMKK
jgi:hypothetical protein